MYGKNCKKGKFYPKNKEKWLNPDKIIYRSSLELNYMRYFDLSPSVLRVSSEETVVPYIYSIDGKVHRYFLDFQITVKNKKGEIKTFLVEIKPKKFTTKPKLPKSGRKTKGFINEMTAWIKNSDKWEYAEKYAKQKGMQFIILTEHDI